MCKIKGEPVGMIANQPLVRAGALDPDALAKEAQFVDIWSDDRGRRRMVEHDFNMSAYSWPMVSGVQRPPSRYQQARSTPRE